MPGCLYREVEREGGIKKLIDKVDWGIQGCDMEEIVLKCMG